MNATFEDSILMDTEMTIADIDQEIINVFGNLSEHRIRMLASKNGIQLTSRAGNLKALLAELTRRLQWRQ